MADTRHTEENHPDTHPSWLADAVFYEIYPQSYADSNSDGIGDIQGIIGKLDYIAGLGCNALWINPCYDSPFKDAGYDVRDYTRVADRYGTNDDLIALFAAAHERGIRVLLDLVPGHTSEEHAWFRASAQPDPADRHLPAAQRTASAPSAEGPNRTENAGGVFRRGRGDSRVNKTAEGSAIAGSVSAADWGSVTPNNASNTGSPSLSERYIWTDSWIAGGDGLPFIGGETDRDGTYILNFFKCQPALNYGFAHPHQPWQKPALGPDALATCDAMVDVMRFWLSRGADGFRVDMADSLVKHDENGKPFTIRTWQYMFSKIRTEFPNAAFVAEWGRPHESMQAGFDMDFYLDWRWDGNPNGYNMLLRNTDTPLAHDGDLSYFNADSGTSIKPFLDQYLPQLADAHRAGGYFDLITCNHDTLRTAQRLTERERTIAYATLMTMPGCPFLYYGDEIGMRYRPLPTKEGGYTRTGSRTPMQWDAALPNLGFSDAPAEALYLPVDPADDAPTVAAAEADPDSLLSTIRTLLALRHATPALHADADFDVLAGRDGGRAFAYRRTAAASVGGTVTGDDSMTGDSVIVAMNPGRETTTLGLPADAAGRDLAFAVGAPSLDGAALTLPAQSFVILR
ncbi:alpha-amylase family glycosyl hydrolase [Bifidobacterium biavatii]|uniref:Alpha amylase catalytic subunit n=1 Tax=Bifidobacterium biavatii DSM 23969 TaxID=1437608 RepID=A0A086ZND9_9BIFI|nr:alpha-amylase family glycosyl hydrolase [Bifidobacterium biavatii]KFI48039.1 alpha amylase catalytic subunit [Bifidobacterium biavatii DSM 23969]